MEDKGNHWCVCVGGRGGGGVNKETIAGRGGGPLVGEDLEHKGDHWWEGT